MTRRHAPPPVPYLTLRDGNRIPQLGFGLLVPPEDAFETVLHGLRTGYRSIDTAAAYRNEVAVRKALERSGIEREEVFITTKLWNHGRDAALRAFERSLRRLGGEYVDLYLIHWPFPAQNRYVETWKALTELNAEGRALSIGVSNFHIEQLERIIDSTGVVPAINQIELHPRFQQEELRRFHSQRGIATEAWSPLGQGKTMRDPAIREVASRHNRTPAQIVLRWQVQLGNVAIPKSVTPGRIEENFRIFDFELNEEDMRSLADLDVGQRVGPDPAGFARSSGVHHAIEEVRERYPAVEPLIRRAKKALSLVGKASRGRS
jgi:2,5-diketo-D-gluconate reductase A